MITIKTPEDIQKLREGGKKLAQILRTVSEEVKPGVTTDHLDALAQKLIEARGDTSAFLGYKPKGAKRPYPASLCVSINDEVVHGIPNEHPRTLKEGDLVKLDLGLIHKGMFTDHAVTLSVGNISKEAEKLISITKKALDIGIQEAKAGKKTGDIGYAIETYARKFNVGIIEELAGHGVGYAVHEDPYVPNIGEKNEGVLLKAGMVIAIEPMFTLGSPDIILDKDGYTVRSKDGSLAAHFEHTVLITENGPEILTMV